ncbi:hypothetical protein [Tichowtungia aerotolerans]|uniref:Right-handed parallel beta-helix repeat-containing protein n=1 Tax=Tichowtungia aerotolerans TaxID=2697043 RepID=A0A6P1M9H6_9BACT|nr:hypothetical protein [Tichowtungia aerotolerans]QHI69214.1 hypothetical protein GT409_07030 [Tichowtungia aerotolerans]
MNIFCSIWMGMLVVLSSSSSPATTLQEIILEKYSNGDNPIIIPPGTYTETTTTVIENLTGSAGDPLVINCQGVYKNLNAENGYKSALIMRDCSYVRLEGLRVDYTPLPLTQGRITDIDSGSTTVEIHEGYPLPEIGGNWEGSSFNFVVNPLTRYIKADARNLSFTNCTFVGGRKYCFSHQALDVDNRTTNDLMRVALIPLKAHGMQLIRCSYMDLYDVQVRTAPGFAILDKQGNSNRYEDVKVNQGPAPAGAVEGRIFSSLRDGMHFSCCETGPVVTNCTVAMTGDDGITVHGFTAAVVSNVANSTTVYLKPSVLLYDRFGNGVNYVQGDSMLFYKADSESRFGNRQVVSVTGPDANHIYTVTLNDTISLQSGDVADNLSRQGSGFEIVGSTVRDTASRGIVVKSRLGKIGGESPGQGNLVAYTFLSGIHLLGTFNGDRGDITAGEGAFSRNIYIGNNTIKHSNLGNTSVDWYCGAINVSNQGADSWGANGHKIITIESNKIYNATAVNIQIAFCNDVDVVGNEFYTPFQYAGYTVGDGGVRSVNNHSLVFLDRVDDVYLNNNSVYDPPASTYDFCDFNSNTVSNISPADPDGAFELK